MKCCTEKSHDHAAQKNGGLKMACQKDCPNCKKKAENKKHNAVKKMLSISTMLTFITFAASAREDGQPMTFWDDPFNSPMLPIYLTMAIIFITVVLVLVVVVYLKKVLN